MSTSEKSSVNKTKIGILISGRGSNMISLAKACEKEDFPAQVAVVISDKPDAKGLEKAAEMGITTATITRKGKTKPEFEDEIHRKLAENGVDFVCLAGFMRVLSYDFIAKWPERILNIHPSLLPSFKGLDAQQQALDAGVKFAGCTVHYVTPEVDSGKIIAQSAVPVSPTDDLNTLSERILAEEHKIYPEALKTAIEEMN